MQQFSNNALIVTETRICFLLSQPKFLKDNVEFSQRKTMFSDANHLEVSPHSYIASVHSYLSSEYSLNIFCNSLYDSQFHSDINKIGSHYILKCVKVDRMEVK